MTSYLLTYLLYQKMSRIKVFQYKISDRMSYLRTIYYYFEIFRKKFHLERVFENQGAGREFHLIFKMKTVLNTQNIGESIFRRRSAVAVKMSPLLTQSCSFCIY